MIDFAVNDQREVPGSLDWLHPSERQLCDAFKFKKRKNDWLLGRWTAKNLVQKNWFKQYDLSEIAILPGENRAPFLYLGEQTTFQQISISHSQGIALCATNDSGSYLGCDLERIEKRSKHFYEAYFTQKERKQISDDAEFLTEAEFYSLYWSAKESVMKALRMGLSLHPLKLEVVKIEKGPAKWNKILVSNLVDLQIFSGIWKIKDEMVYVVLSAELEAVHLNRE